MISPVMRRVCLLTHYLFVHFARVSFGCSIAIADFNDEDVFNISICDPAERVSERSGILQARSLGGNGSSHATSQFAGPYWLSRAIKASKYYTEDINSADAVFVNNYCQTMTALSGGDAAALALSELAQGHQILANLPRFLKNSGTDFVFFTPFPIFGVSRWDPMTCQEFGRSMHIVIESVMRYICPHSARQKYMIVPYASTQFENAENNPMPRDIELFFHGHCSGYHGKLMRAHVVNTLNSLNAMSNMSVHCRTTFEDNHHALQGVMQRSLFCLVIPGDTASSRRLTETVLAGCIPVFVGPPWHSMPLAFRLDYSKFALFIELEEFLSFNGVDVFDRAPENDSAADVFQPQWWIADADISSHVFHVQDVQGMLELLRSLGQLEIQILQENGAAIQSLFTYQPQHDKHAVNVPDLIIDTICHTSGQGPRL